MQRFFRRFFRYIPLPALIFFLLGIAAGVIQFLAIRQTAFADHSGMGAFLAALYKAQELQGSDVPRIENLAVGFIAYREAITWNKVVGVAICLAGLAIINLK